MHKQVKYQSKVEGHSIFTAYSHNFHTSRRLGQQKTNTSCTTITQQAYSLSQSLGLTGKVYYIGSSHDIGPIPLESIMLAFRSMIGACEIPRCRDLVFHT